MYSIKSHVHPPGPSKLFMTSSHLPIRLYFRVLLFVGLSVFAITIKLNNEIFTWVGPEQRKKKSLKFGKYLGLFLDIKKLRIFNSPILFALKLQYGDTLLC